MLLPLTQAALLNSHFVISPGPHLTTWPSCSSECRVGEAVFLVIFFLLVVRWKSEVQCLLVYEMHSAILNYHIQVHWGNRTPYLGICPVHGWSSGHLCQCTSGPQICEFLSVFCRQKKEERDIPVVELDLLLGQFFKAITKVRLYEPDSLTGFQQSINRYLQQKGYSLDIQLLIKNFRLLG